MALDGIDLFTCNNSLIFLDAGHISIKKVLPIFAFISVYMWMHLSHSYFSLLMTKLMPTYNIYGKPTRCNHSREANWMERAKGTLAISSDNSSTS